MGDRWTIEQVAAVAPSPSQLAAGQGVAVPASWVALGADQRSLWGRCRGSGTEPYETMVDHVGVAFRCSCPSRKHPCKHAIALLLLWAQGLVPGGDAPASVAGWIGGRDRRVGRDDVAAAESPSTAATATAAPDDAGSDARAAAERPAEPGGRERGRDDRIARTIEGLVELDRWLHDRVRTGLADPALAQYATWDTVAARLVDARAGALANRVRRLAGIVGAQPQWHEHVLAELGLLHLIARAGMRVPELQAPLDDAVATAIGWQVRQADVLAGVPDTDEWFVAGRSDTREDRIEVRRVWLRGRASGRWAVVLSFAAYRQALDTSLTVGDVVTADLHRYPGPALRALVGRRHGAAAADHAPLADTIGAAIADIGHAIAAEPWLERYPAIVRAWPTVDRGRWVLADHTGSVPMVAEPDAVASVLACSAGTTVAVTVEWTPDGVIPLTVHLPDRAVDVGRRADPSFVSAA
jgi:hypothetical protein